MKSITLRDLPDNLSRRILERSRKTGASLNKTVIEMLSESEPSAKGRLHHDLDHLAGSWSETDGEELAPLLESQRAIDAELWK